MNDSASLCTEERLALLLHSEIESDETRLTARHVEHCRKCQRRLEEMAAEPSDWEIARESLLYSKDDDSCDLPASILNRPWNRRVRKRQSLSWTESVARQLLLPPSHPEMLGRIGRYEVERLIGSGGMGIVFKAFDTELNRPVAVKVLAPHLAGTGAARQRFSREARAAAAVVHEHVVPIHNVESEGASPFLVMPYIAGESLQQRIDRKGPLELCELLRIAMQTATGLAAAHEQGLVHRDVKPSNILVEQGVERALLTDFGLARASDDASLTHTGYHPGTPQYMSPEQARGEGVDARSDLFSLGSVIYTMCVGRPPFRAETSYGILRKITDTEPRPICELNPAIPVWLDAIVAKLLAKNVAERFQSANVVAELLKHCLAHVQQPTAVSLPQELTRLSARTTFDRLQFRWRLGIAGASIMVTASIAVMLFLDRTVQPSRQPTAAHSPAESTPEVEAEVDWNHVSSDLDSLNDSLVPFETRSERLWDGSIMIEE